jgi:hypothetical protein
MNTINNMLLTGCGTSRHAAELGAKIMRDLECFDTVSVMDAAEVRTRQYCTVFSLPFIPTDHATCIENLALLALPSPISHPFLLSFLGMLPLPCLYILPSSPSLHLSNAGEEK